MLGVGEGVSESERLEVVCGVGARETGLSVGVWEGQIGTACTYSAHGPKGSP